MTNHISRELAEEIANESGAYPDTSGRVLFDSVDEFTTALNLAIDKVIGEPVAFAFQDSNSNWDKPSLTQHSVGMQPLYAPKEVK